MEEQEGEEGLTCTPDGAGGGMRVHEPWVVVE